MKRTASLRVSSLKGPTTWSAIMCNKECGQLPFGITVTATKWKRKGTSTSTRCTIPPPPHHNDEREDSCLPVALATAKDTCRNIKNQSMSSRVSAAQFATPCNRASLTPASLWMPPTSSTWIWPFHLVPQEKGIERMTCEIPNTLSQSGLM